MPAQSSSLELVRNCYQYFTGAVDSLGFVPECTAQLKDKDGKPKVEFVDHLFIRVLNIVSRWIPMVAGFLRLYYVSLDCRKNFANATNQKAGYWMFLIFRGVIEIFSPAGALWLQSLDKIKLLVNYILIGNLILGQCENRLDQKEFLGWSTVFI